MNQVKSKREANIQIAYKNGDWDTISKLLNQSYENARRKDRYYQVLSLNYPNINSQGQISELENFIASSTLTPIECLLLKERQIEVNKALSLLSKTDYEMIIDFYLDHKSYSQISREVGISDKTVKKRIIKATTFLKQSLENIT
ncbi:sigma-70 family RNA polymerase sigma factor [Staphylococcus epidermidis]|uniref:RNA polymerase sigma factor n=1 Tax=Staphylococcus epidermidis TaxID=1282 RepID=UPI00136939EA|nr:sigma-70 family RNA polymerase sigma factor [Staphylococcus epidermidis]MDU6032292.1 sigma-70 family RNA polymerase sigma factor [Peptoniphilus harei]MBM6336697.1 sigma-70 family RNA polymerase sigma factor [Staphylococcus epidermidis]MBM6343433.1 sigma-70 family RNA polymerase sigma factor [Staphylococcus epidermidis]MBM6356475.1 sigma-70 family RNA polymerase sigma factor [Staphylococcus epidermidis]MBO0391162.1 sigma-70 family RNA polymerase sigma factor [Staphylococcus epidermidis]